MFPGRQKSISIFLGRETHSLEPGACKSYIKTEVESNKSLLSISGPQTLGWGGDGGQPGAEIETPLPTPYNVTTLNFNSHVWGIGTLGWGGPWFWKKTELPDLMPASRNHTITSQNMGSLKTEPKYQDGPILEPLRPALESSFILFCQTLTTPELGMLFKSCSHS